jgi:hypothetical protein
MTFFPKLEFTGNVLYCTWLKSESWSVRNWFFCSSIDVWNDVPTLTFCNGGIISSFQTTRFQTSQMLMRNCLLCLNHYDGYYFASWWKMNNLISGKNNDLLGLPRFTQMIFVWCANNSINSILIIVFLKKDVYSLQWNLMYYFFR